MPAYMHTYIYIYTDNSCMVCKLSLRFVYPNPSPLASVVLPPIDCNPPLSFPLPATPLILYSHPTLPLFWRVGIATGGMLGARGGAVVIPTESTAESGSTPPGVLVRSESLYVVIYSLSTIPDRLTIAATAGICSKAR